MTDAATLPAVTSLGAEWYKAPIDFNHWARSARRIWSYYRRRTRHGKREFTKTDREIAREIGGMDGRPMSRRSVQRGHWFLHHVYKTITRDHDHPDHKGRVVRVLLPLAGDDKEKQGPEGGATPKAKPGPTTTRATTTTAAPAPAATAPAPEEAPADWGELRRKVAAQAAADAAARAEAKAAAVPPAGPIGVGAAEAAARELTDDEFRRLERDAARGFITSGDRKILEAARRLRGP